MKALTICQPYAHLIVCGEKRVENRTWPTRYRGPLLIHAGKSKAWLTEEDGMHYADGKPRKIDYDEATGKVFDFGALVGVAELVDCVHIDTIESRAVQQRHPWLYDHPHTEGPWCWVLQNVRRFGAVVPCKGEQGLWECDDSLVPYNAAVTRPQGHEES